MDATLAGAEPVYGVLQIATAQVAVALDALREVIPCPPQFGGLPARAPGLLGAVDLRGKVVPVLDLRTVLGAPDSERDGHVVVVLRRDNRLLGLLVEGVRGLTQPAAGSIGRVAAVGGGLLFSGSFERPEDRSVVSVLDTDAVMRLPGVPVLRDDAPADQAGGATALRSAPRRALMLVRCGAVGLAMDVADIHTTLPRVTLIPSPLAGRVCRGVIEHAGQQLPAVDPLALMELGRLDTDTPCEALLLRFETGCVALLVSQVIDIARVTEAELLPLPPLAVRRPELFQAALTVPGRGVHLMLGAAALHDEPALRALAALNTARTGPDAAHHKPTGTDSQAAAGRGEPVITYDLGAVVATRLAQVAEVLPLPAGCAPLAGAHPAASGMFIHRGHAVTLVCLATLLGASARPAPAEARVLLVSHGGAQFGFVVPRLCHIETTQWERPRAATGKASGDRAPWLGLHSVVELGSGDQRRTLHLIDLHALAASLAASVSGSPQGQPDAALEGVASSADSNASTNIAATSTPDCAAIS